ncbi:GrdX family protein [Proteiniborus sp. MB09-C3]|uniref:GrdX family protein n=1 Tax=Proteiniborus sp. MB09-C3 TaxID=3050072 RepID=UPI0025544E99|nr:GrdX family protein [Proteiniborus sp. MB09-C3]WIV10367.1 GrdX family protein [Proteiniborus sp. MB09-C3]
MGKIIVTNNPLIGERFAALYEIEFYDKDYIGILETVRDKIHLGHELLSHPLAGSIKPNETPYRTVIISKDKKQLDMNSLTLIESAIVTTRKFISNRPTPDWNNVALFDFQTVDLSLIENVLNNVI